MSKRQDQRSRLNCIAAYKLRQQGLSTKQIAEQLGCKPEAVAGKVKVGERFASEAS